MGAGVNAGRDINRAGRERERVKEKLSGRDFTRSGVNMARKLNQQVMQGHVHAYNSIQSLAPHKTKGGSGDKTSASLQPEQLTVSQQVDMLVNEATSHENLCQSYSGW